MHNEIQAIISRIQEILLNRNKEPLDRLGSYIVGATIVRSDIDYYYDKYPLLEEVAELGADLETLGGSEYATKVFAEIKEKFRLLEEQIKSDRSR